MAPRWIFRVADVTVGKGQQEERKCHKIEGGERGDKVFRKEGSYRGSRAVKIGKEHKETGKAEHTNCKPSRVMGDSKNGGTDII